MHSLVGLHYATDRKIASHPGSLPESLEALSESSDEETIRAVAGNPATPPGALIRVASLAPLDFFQNPVLDLLILEDPSFLSKLKPGALRAFLKTDDCPLSWLQWAAHYGTKGDQLEVLKREDLPLEMLKGIANGPHPKTAERAINRLLELGETW
jgi:hypothetical protein